MATARAEAEQAQVKQVAAHPWATAEDKVQEAQKALDAKRYAEAKPRFDDARTAYGQATAEAQRVAARNEVAQEQEVDDKARPTMATTKEESQHAHAKQMAEQAEGPG